MTKSQPTNSSRVRARRGAAHEPAALTRAKMALAAAHEHGERDVLSRALRAHPAAADALSDFSMSLRATGSYEDEALTPDVSEIAAAARTRAFAAVFGAETADVASLAGQQAATLKSLRQARGVTLTAAALALGLGVDVLSALEAGRIRVASAPRQLIDGLGELLDTAAGQVAAALGAYAAPAFRRGALGGASADASAAPPVDFADAVLLSHNMTPEEKARWLAETTGPAK